MLAACQLPAQSAEPDAGSYDAEHPTPGRRFSRNLARPLPSDDVAQMRTDLDRMESLLGNMSSEIEFLRDQNLQILLRTNAQMWTMLIRDLRRPDRPRRAAAESHPAARKRTHCTEGHATLAAVNGLLAD